MMESWPEKKPRKNRFDHKPSGRHSSNRLQSGPFAFPASETAGRRKPAGKSTGRLLQVGCREGNFLLNVRKNFGAVYGTDKDPEALKEAARRHLPVTLSSGGNLPYPGASFDFLLAFDAGKWMAAPGQFLSEASRVLKRGGEMIVTFPAPFRLTEKNGKKGFQESGTYDWPALFEAAGLELFLAGTDALWDSPAFPPVPSFSQAVYLAGLFNLFFLIEPCFPWQFGENLIFWLKKK